MVSPSTASPLLPAWSPESDIDTDFGFHGSPTHPFVFQGTPSKSSTDSQSGGVMLPSTEDCIPSSPSDSSYGKRTPRMAAASPTSTPDSSPPSFMRPTTPVFCMDKVAAAINNVADEVHNSPKLAETAPVTPSRPPRRTRKSTQKPQTYDVRQDEPPPHRFHSPSVQVALNDARSVVSGLSDVLASGTLHTDDTSTIGRLHKQAQNLSQFQCLSTRTVGFVGASGVGKSSLLNSLLDMRGLARANSNGDACTSVVTEYHHHDRSDFVIDVELFSTDEVMAQVTQLFQSLCQYEAFLDDRQSATKDEEEELEKKANVASCTFEAMFRSKPGYQELAAEMPDDAMLSTLQQWTKDLMPHHIRGCQTLDTLSACSKKVMQLTSETNPENQSAVWPYIRKIKVFVKAHILSKGLVLVDLPGLRDVNLARQVITELYLRECDDIFAVCGTGRAIADAGVNDVINLAAKARLSNVGIICTKSDEIQAAEATDRRAKQLNEAVRISQQDFDEIEQRVRELEAEEEDLLEDEEKELTELLRHSRRVKKILENRKTELKIHMVDSVATRIAEKLKRNYGQMVPGNRLHVFCVSNKDYWEVRDQLKDDAVLRLVNLSGIPAVRKHCLAMVADSNLRLAAKYVNNDIPALLGDVSLWVESGAGCLAAEQKQLVRNTLDGLESRLKTEFSGHNSPMVGFGRLWKNEFNVKIYKNRRTKDWAQAASCASNDWSSWHPSSYSAFCRQYGDYCTDKAGSHNWNEEAIEAMVLALSPRWTDLCDSVKEEKAEAANHVEVVLRTEIETLETELKDLPQSPETLIRTLSSREAILSAEIENLHMKFESDLLTLETDALTGIRSSLFGKAMEEAYRAANNEYGSGSHRRRISLIDGTVSSFRTYNDLLKAFRKRFCELADGLQGDVEGLVTEHLQIIEETLDIVRNDNIVTESEQNPKLREHVEEKTGAAKEAMIRIQKALA